MPNWCENTLTVSHDDIEQLDRFCKAWNSGELLQTLIPCPAELRDTVAGSVGGEGYEKALHAAREELNIKFFGYKNWYDWCVSEWGTKWDVGRSDERDNGAEIKKNRVQVSFDSAWAPPVEAYHKLSAMGYKIKAYYYEPGMAFCGKFEDGKEDTYQLHGSIFDIAKNVPADILDAFNIIELMESYQEEE